MAPAEAIKKLRKRKRLTRDAFGRKIGVDRSAVYRWEHGGRISPANLRVLETAYPEVVDAED